jgi:hypothetical protein
MRSAATVVLFVLAAASARAQGPATLDFEFFRTQVQPIFLHKRPGLARCYVCHSQGTPLVLQKLSPGAAMWDEEQSRKNFETIRRVVAPGEPRRSRLLLMPLAEEAGGVAFHPGGKHFMSQDDPEWRVLADWVNGARPGGASRGR